MPWEGETELLYQFQRTQRFDPEVLPLFLPASHVSGYTGQGAEPLTSSVMKMR